MTALLLLCLTRFGMAQPLRFEQLSTEQGLSQSVVNCIFQDSRGFLWLGTQGGLNRYDGYGFKVYEHDAGDPASLSHDWVLTLVEGPSGDLWIATEGGGVSRWRQTTDSFTSYRNDPNDPQSLSGDFIVALAWDPDGSLWIGARDSGLNRFEPSDPQAQAGVFQRFRHRPDDPASLADDRIRAVYVDRSQRLWVGTWGGGLELFERKRQTFSHFRHDPGDPRSLSDDHVRAITEDPHGALWIGTQAGLNRYDPESGSFERYLHDPAVAGSLSHDRVRSLLVDRDGRLWVGTDGGLNLWQQESGRLRPGRFASYHPDPKDPYSLGSDQVLALFQDRSGVLWISTVGTGVSKWNPATWEFSQYLSNDRGGTGSTVFAISEASDGALWIGTFGDGLMRLDRDPVNRAPLRRIRYRHDPSDDRSLRDDRVTALLHDRQGTLWVGTVGGGLGRLDRSTGSFEHHRHDPRKDDSLSDDSVTALHQSRDGKLWVATLRGLDLRLPEGTFRHFRHHPEDPESLAHDRVFSLAEDPEGRLWLATDGGGLNRLDVSTGAFLRVRHDPQIPRSLSSDELLAVHIDARGRLWAGTKSSGLEKLESLDATSGEARFENYSRSQGLPDNTIWGILSEPEGPLWLSTTRGLARLDPETGTVRSYDTSHGLPANELNQGSHFRSASGELFFGTVNGVTAFFPDRLRSNITVPPVVLTRFTRFNEPVGFDRPLFDVDSIELSYSDHFLAFEFSALDFIAPAKNQYRYQLAGFDDAWVDLGRRRRVDFTDFEPGDYVLRVQGSNSEGVWNEDGLEVRIRVRPPFWATWWFRALVLIAAAGAVRLGYDLKTRSVRRNARRLRELVEARTTELEAAQEQLLRNERLTVLGELAGSVAHEIRNPLAVIKNALFLLQRQLSADAAVGDQLAIVYEEIRRTDRIVTELLDYARSRPTAFRPFALQEAASQALAAIEIPHEIQVDRRFEPQPLNVMADAEQIRQILVNLLENAVQAMSDGGELQVDCRSSDGEATVAVLDTGPGIPEEHLSKVFEPLFTTKANGIGLGLPLSLRYARLNRGRIECGSLPGTGAFFRLILPISSRPESGRAECTQ